MAIDLGCRRAVLSSVNGAAGAALSSGAGSGRGGGRRSRAAKPGLP